MPVSTVIKNCKVVKPEGIINAGIAIDGEKIVAIGRDQDLPAANKVIDAKGNYVIPGLVDAHMHLMIPDQMHGCSRDILEADLERDTRASACGGVTTVITLNIGTNDLTEDAAALTKLYQNHGYADMAISGVILGDKSDQLIKGIQKAADYGISSYKLLMPYKGEETHWTHIPGIDDGTILMTLEEVARLARQGYRIFARAHCEVVEFYWKYKQRFTEQGIEPDSWNQVRPNFIEVDGMRRFMSLSQITGCPLYVVHMTIKEGPEIIRKARGEGIKVKCETCPQYLVLNTDNTDRVFSLVNPPIRQKEDNEALWEALRDGTIDVVATDHAPIRKEEKPSLYMAGCGLAGAETWLPIMLSEGVNKKRISLERVVEVCCENPAKIYGLAPRKGMIEVGSDADLVIVDLNKKVKWSASKSHARSDYSGYEGWEFKGWPVMTMVRGTVVMEDSKIVGKAVGKYVPAATR